MRSAPVGVPYHDGNGSAMGHAHRNAMVVVGMKNHGNVMKAPWYLVASPLMPMKVRESPLAPMRCHGDCRDAP